ncbi:cell wall hydrolase [Sphingomonas sp. 3-13AW]|uniref:cell wall hydrolase n=1 Tax=Sphingomonas sp. 3-13AW TaxID=3050450 RepID=UPI003BB4B41A
MRFLTAAAALMAVSTPALAMDFAATSRAIPPADDQDTSGTSSAAERIDVDRVAPPAVPFVGSEAPRQFQASTSAKPKHDDAQQTCVAQAVYYESKGEPLKGQRAVADVVINRTKRRGFASTPCGVIRQPHQFTNAHRWGVPSAADPIWQRAKEIARNALDGIGTVSTAITHFHSVAVRPGWNMRRVASIGRHVFY